MFVSCDTATSDPHRFVIEGNYEADGEGCSLRTMRDKYTGCEYLIACNSITSMPHTCKVDDPNDYGMHP